VSTPTPPSLPAPARERVATRPVTSQARPTQARTTPAGPTRVRTVPARTAVRQVRGATDGAPRWVSGLLAGSQAALLSLLVVTVPALAAYVATSADPSNAGIGWSHSLAVGAAFWLMGHGATLAAGGATVSVVPLGLTSLALFSCYASARRSAHPTVSAWWAAVGGYGFVVGVVVLLAGPAGPLGAGATSVARTVLGTTLVAGVGLGAGIFRVRGMRQHTRRLWTLVHPVARQGVTAGALVGALLVGAAALVTCAWVVSGRAGAGDVVEGLGVDTFGGVLLAVSQLALLPNLVLWALAWLVGPGFSVGAGTLYSPAVVVSGPLPALPLLGALPPEGTLGGPLLLAPLVVVAAGAIGGWWLHRRVVSTRATHPFVAVLAAALTAGILCAFLTALAGGSAGPGRLASVGGHTALVGLACAGLALGGALLTAVPSDPMVQAATMRAVRRGWVQVRPSAQADEGRAAGSESDTASGMASGTAGS
jgi:hypothetical protein